MELFRKCAECNTELPINSFCKSKSRFFRGGYVNICNNCLDKIIKICNDNDRWNKVNKICQWIDIPFIPSEWEKVYSGNSSNWMGIYSRVFGTREFSNLTWREYNDIYLKLQQSDELVEEVPGYLDSKYEALVKKWGAYERTDLDKLENLFNETLATQNVTTGNQIDQLKKICKTSLLIDERISANQPYKDLMDSYEKLIKAAELTPKNTKNSNDFDSIGEVYEYLEQIGWINKHYDNIKRDEVDETIKNMQNWTRKLCVGESTLTEEIYQKLNAINNNDEIDIDNFDYDVYEKEATDLLQKEDIEVEV